jgi:hypothetical protein
VSDIETNALTGYIGGYEMSAERKKKFGKTFESMAVFCLVISITGLISTNTGNGVDLMILNHMIFYYGTVKYLNIMFVDISVF